MKLNELTVSDVLVAMSEGTASSEQLVRDCLERISLRDPDVQAWTYIDAQAAIEQAKQKDEQRLRGDAVGLLHGVPVAIKDMIYTADMPTQHNSPLYQGYWPVYDAACVRMLKNAGAIILGKVHTAEFASMGRLAPTRNPHDFSRTPGGSSSGSAAAVADVMVPLALGTQTGGSTIRPAAFCGIYGMKPSYGLVPIEGVRPYAPSIDTVGLMARSIGDLALLCQALAVIEEPLMPAKLSTKTRIGLFRTSMWHEAQDSSQQVVLQVANRLKKAGVKIEEVESSIDFAQLTEAQNIIMHGEGRRAFLAEYGCYKDSMHPDTRGEAENVLAINSEQMRNAYDFIAYSRVQVEREMQDFDAWLTPAVIGEAPVGLASTGLAIFNRCWSALHCPCITVPASRSAAMPIGVQMVTRRFCDYSLLALVSALDSYIKLDY